MVASRAANGHHTAGASQVPIAHAAGVLVASARHGPGDESPHQSPGSCGESPASCGESPGPAVAPHGPFVESDGPCLQDDLETARQAAGSISVQRDSLARSLKRAEDDFLRMRAEWGIVQEELETIRWMAEAHSAMASLYQERKGASLVSPSFVLERTDQEQELLEKQLKQQALEQQLEQHFKRKSTALLETQLQEMVQSCEIEQWEWEQQNKLLEEVHQQECSVHQLEYSEQYAQGGPEEYVEDYQDYQQTEYQPEYQEDFKRPGASAERTRRRSSEGQLQEWQEELATKQWQLQEWEQKDIQQEEEKEEEDWPHSPTRRSSALTKGLPTRQATLRLRESRENLRDFFPAGQELELLGGSSEAVAATEADLETEPFRASPEEVWAQSLAMPSEHRESAVPSEHEGAAESFEVQQPVLGPQQWDNGTDSHDAAPGTAASESNMPLLHSAYFRRSQSNMHRDSQLKGLSPLRTVTFNENAIDTLDFDGAASWAEAATRRASATPTRRPSAAVAATEYMALLTANVASALPGPANVAARPRRSTTAKVDDPVVASARETLRKLSAVVFEELAREDNHPLDESLVNTRAFRDTQEALETMFADDESDVTVSPSEEGMSPRSPEPHPEPQGPRGSITHAARHYLSALMPGCS
ncbi:unnamed protein product [Polarella glacialis]|uniref:Uncharacterized protein n=1 Tax=Polarella glacialis TaxID=89957 RepID=A0A813KEJ0_POLGL|nr:unnamed protein product [Polarella glacialis]